MEDPLPLASPSATCAPYRTAPATGHPPPTERPSRALTIASWVLSALALAAALTSLHLTCTLAGLARIATARTVMSTIRPETRLAGAVEELARRQRVPLVIAPGIDARALREVVPESSDGAYRATLRALDAYAARHGLWLHDDDGVLHLDREVRAVEFACVGSLDVCATRLERHASIFIEREATPATRDVNLRLTREGSAVEATRIALVAAGFQVDVVGRTLHVAEGIVEAPTVVRAPDASIRALGRGVYVLPRTVVDAALNDQTELMRSTRITPLERGGRVVGVRVFGLRPTTLPWRLGMRNGDVVLRVNGCDISSPDHCLTCYSRLRSTDQLRVEIERDGRPTTLTWLIV
jgi:hypothetical protein